MDRATVPLVSVPLREVPAHDLPRERLQRGGPAVLSDAELLAVHLGSGTAGRNAVELARQLIVEFGSLHALSRASVVELERVSGVGPAKACRVVAAFALAARIDGPGERRVVMSSADVAETAIPVIGAAAREELLVLVVDGGNRVVRVESVSRGGATTTRLPVRDVLSVVLRYDGVGFALAHNHPGGDATPSDDDKVATDRIRAAARKVGLRFLDHVVVAGEQWRSVTASR